MKKIFSILFALVLVVGLGLVMPAPVLAGTTRYVPSVYSTIQKAIDAASPGDTIMVAAGDYDGFLVQGKSNIGIISTEGATITTAVWVPIAVGPIEEGAWVMAAVNASENIDIEGINFDGTAVEVAWTSINQVAGGGGHTVGLKDDGTVVTVGVRAQYRCCGEQHDVGGWTNITQIAAGWCHTVGLESDGTAVAVGDNSGNYTGQCNVGGWTNITQVAAGAAHTLGLKSNGTAVAAGNNTNGQCNVGNWTNITQVDAGDWYTVGRKNDGTAVAVGDNYYGQCNVSGWSGITQVAAGNAHTVGLKNDGTAVAVGSNSYGQCTVGGWTNITQVAAGNAHTVGLKSDGTVVAVGRNDYGQCAVGNWTDIIQLDAGAYFTLGLKWDGTVVAVGDNRWGQCEADEGNLVGIGYFDSTGSITDLTVANINGTEAWAGVAIIGDVGTSTVSLSGVTVQNSVGGVSILNAEANIDGCTTTEVDAGIVTGFPGYGSNPSTVSIHGSNISDNFIVGIYVCDDSIVEAHFNNIAGNSLYGVANGGSETVDATYNWWGHASGPYHATLNPDGLGDAIYGNVDFEPWLGTQSTAVTETVTNGTVDARDEADTEVAVTGTATVTVFQYPSNPGGSPPSGFSMLGNYIDVYVPDTGNVTEIEIRLYYTDAEVTAAGVPEDSLRLFWWNGSAWVQCSDSGVNTASIYGYSGYMWAKIRTNTTPSLAQLQGTGFSGVGYQGPTTPGGCFIATAAYGTDTAKQLDILREFRDTVLLPNSLGAKFVSFYYRTSPPIANFISQHEALRTVVRVGFIDPIVKILSWTHALWAK